MTDIAVKVNVQYLGVDVSRDTLDLASLESNRALPKQVANNSAAIKQWLGTLPAGVHLVCEATGPYHLALARACWAAGVTLSVVNPLRVRKFAGASGQRAKTDKLDAKLLTKFGESQQPKPTAAPAPCQEQLAMLVTRRNQLVVMRTEELNRGKAPGLDKAALRSINAHLRWLDKELAKLEQAADQLVAHTPVLAHQVKVLAAIQGLGPTSAKAILAALPEIGDLSRQRAASLAGLAPFTRESGRYRGQSRIGGGRADLRLALYMPAMTAMRCNPVLAPFAAKGKPFHLIIVALMRKLLIYAVHQLKNHPYLPHNSTL